MDNITIDLGPETDVEPGAPAVLIGAQGSERILAEEIAVRLETINYEVTCGISQRVPREVRGVTPPALEDAFAAAPSIAAARTALEEQAGSAWIVGGAIRDALLGAAGRGCRPGGAPGTRSTPRARSPRVAGGLGLRALRGARHLAGGRRDRRLACRRQPRCGPAHRGGPARPDFTVNAIAIPLAGGDPIDPTGGSPTPRCGCCASPPSATSMHDPLRLLRACRLASVLSLEIESGTGSSPGTADARRRPRRRAPVRRAAGASSRGRPAPGRPLMDELALTAAVLPELEALRGVVQNPNHHLDVFGHTLAVLEEWLGIEGDLRRVRRRRRRPRSRVPGGAARRRAHPAGRAPLRRTLPRPG